MIYDINMEDFRIKAWLLDGGHMTEDPPTIAYEIFISRENIIIALTIAVLNDLEVKSAVMLKSYVSDHSSSVKVMDNT